MATTIAPHPFAHIMGGAYTFVGISFPEDRESEQAQRASDGLPYTTNLCGGTCAHCHTAIQIVVQIKGADGIFKVGSDCAKRVTQSPRVIDAIKKELAARTTKQRKAKLAAEFTAAIQRDYHLFGKMAGVRCQVENPFELKGLPDDASIVTRKFCDNEDRHHFSWVSEEEIQELVALNFLNEVDPYDYEYPPFASGVRWVFCFDN